ncbi:hypothetical protein ALT1000_370045 [Alteromonas macleodii]|nr:hypothetical protein BFV96_4701 [Alteromonas macleodii]
MPSKSKTNGPAQHNPAPMAAITPLIKGKFESWFNFSYSSL